MGQTISRSIKDTKALGAAIAQSYSRDKGWIEFHADTLADLVDEVEVDKALFELAAVERKAVDLWQDGNFESAISRIEKAVESRKPDAQTAGWLKQLAARVADSWGHLDKSQELQREAFATNRSLLRPKVLPPYCAVPQPGDQARAIAEQIDEYRPRRGFLQAFEEVVARF